MKKATVALSTDFFTAYAKLPKKIQSKATDFISKFMINPTSSAINYEKIKDAADKRMRSVKIDLAYRGIVFRQEESGVYILLWVDHHDEAYDWAVRRSCQVNKETGNIQVFEAQPEIYTYAVGETEGNDKDLFSKVNDSNLLKMGVPQEQLSFVRSIKDKSVFYHAKSKLSADVYENLEYYVGGIPINEILEMCSYNTEEVTDDMSVALKTDRNQRSFKVIDNEDELLLAMSEPLEKWRIFLHPTQREIVERTYSGACRISGGAGTGKTVVAMHRAKWLASQLGKGEKILFTTFTSNLTSNIKENLRKICNSEEFRRIDVMTLDSWINEFMTKSGTNHYIEYIDNVIKSLWTKAITRSDVELDLPASFYYDEWSEVITVHGAFTIEEYMRASRIGRGIPLDRKKRIQVWKVFDEYINIIKGRKGRDIDTAMYECRVALSENPTKIYKHVIIDEGQDFSSNAYMLLRAIASSEHENDMFIVGDSHQRIYDKKAILSKCGINIRGRSSILKINYRTTEETRKYAFAILKDIQFDDLDGEYETEYYCQSLTHGDYPKVENFNTYKEELEYIINEVNALADSGVDLRDICVVARTHSILKKYKNDLISGGIKTYEISNLKHDDRSITGIRIATMHRVKGIEFQYIFVVAANKNVIPQKRAVADNGNDSITAEKCLLYVALTRAQKAAYITSYGTKSEFLV